MSGPEPRRVVRLVWVVYVPVALAVAVGAAARDAWGTAAIAALTATVAVVIVAVKRRLAPWAPYQLEPQHQELSASVDMSPEGCTLLDAHDGVALVCHHRVGRSGHIVSRIHVDDLVTAIAELRDGAALSSFMVERFLLGPDHAPVVIHRVEPWAIRSDHTGRIVTADLAEPPSLSKAQWRAYRSFLFASGAGFASAAEVDVLIGQLCRTRVPAAEN